MRISLLSGYHLTATERKAIAQMIKKGMESGKTRRKHFLIRDEGEGVYAVVIRQNERNMIGSDLKPVNNHFRIRVQRGGA